MANWLGRSMPTCAFNSRDMSPKQVIIRCLALALLFAICGQMAVCMIEDQGPSAASPAGSRAPAGSDCSCHDCGCCSLHVGFPPKDQALTAFLIETVKPAPEPGIIAKALPRLERPPRP